MQRRLNVLRFKTWRDFLHECHVISYLLKEVRKIDNM